MNIVKHERFRINALYSLVLLCFCTSLGIILTLGIQEYIELKTQMIMNKISERYGLQISMQDSDVSSNDIEFKGITFGHQASTRVGSIKAKLNMNPMKGPLGFANQIKVSGLRIKATVAELKNILQLWSQDKPEIHSPLKTAASPADPISFDLEDAAIEILRENGSTLARLLSLTLQHNTAGASSIKVGRLEILDKKIELKHITAELKRIANDNWQLHISSPTLGPNATVHLTTKTQEQSAVVEWFLETLPEFTTRHLPENLALTLQSKGRVEFNMNPSKTTIHFRSFAHFKDIYLQHDVLSKNRLGPLQASAKAIGNYNITQETLRIHDGVIAARNALRNDVLKFPFKMESTHIHSGRITTLFADVHDIPCQTALHILPSGFAPHLNSFELDGSLSSSLEFSLLNTDWQSFDFRAHHTQFGCKIKTVPQRFSLKTLRHGTHLASKTSGGLTLAPLGQTTGRRILSYEELPTTLRVALVASEDTGFWKHNGFEFENMISALKKNISEGQIMMGGSTISMQTAKNLFLNQERTLSRKAEEIFLTWYLEKYVGKKRILELYANIIEFGPGLYGAEYAAYKIFGKDLALLSLRESIFLSTLLPSPIKRFENACHASLTPGFKELMNVRAERVAGLLSLDRGRVHHEMMKPLHFNPQLQRDVSKCASHFIATSPRPPRKAL